MFFVLLFLLNFFSLNAAPSVDVVIFSHTRARDLEKVLDYIDSESLVGISEVFIFHDSHHTDGPNGYYRVKNKFFADATFVNLGNPPQATIKHVIFRICDELDASHMAFIDDQFLVHDKIDLIGYINKYPDSIIVFEANKSKLIVMKKELVYRFYNIFENMQFNERVYFPAFRLDDSNVFIKKVS